jgi:predicted alpha/beta superfamily hydrolase
MDTTPHTAHPNVWVLDEAFNIPQLGRTRRIWIYVPQNYHESEERYPVIYMHDGQNLFDQATAFDKEWEVDETLNSLDARCLIVGIDNSEHRMQEYNFNSHEEYGPGEGKRYMEFITQTLKPHIDAHFRTKPEKEHTHIAGSSMGGLISLYGALHFANSFGSAGIFSPSLWLAPNAVKELGPVAAQNEHFPQHFYFYGGAKEGCNMVENIGKIVDMLAQYPYYQLTIDIDGKGEHSEDHWREKFAHYYKWVMEGEDLSHPE